MYLTRDAIAATLRQVATLAAGSTLAMMFMLPQRLAEPEERPQYQAVQKSARAAGTPDRRLERITDRERHVCSPRAPSGGRTPRSPPWWSAPTVKTHVSRLLAKLQARDRGQLPPLAGHCFSLPTRHSASIDSNREAGYGCDQRQRS